MKKNIIQLVIAVLFLSSAHYVNAQELQEILDRHFYAVGQRELMGKKTHTVKATVEQMGMQIPMSIHIKRPNKFRLEMEMQGQKMVQVFDGEKGWMIAPWMGQEPRELTDAEIKQAMEQTNMDGELFNYALKGTEASLIGKVNMAGIPMYNIKLILQDGNVKNYYIDAGDFMIKKVIARIAAQGKEMELEQNLSEYKNFDGVMLPTKIESINPMGKATIKFTEISFNDEINDSVFKKP